MKKSNKKLIIGVGAAGAAAAAAAAFGVHSFRAPQNVPTAVYGPPEDFYETPSPTETNSTEKPSGSFDPGKMSRISLISEISFTNFRKRVQY